MPESHTPTTEQFRVWLLVFFRMAWVEFHKSYKSNMNFTHARAVRASRILLPSRMVNIFWGQSIKAAWSNDFIRM